MTKKDIRAALETALASITPSIATVFENTDYTPVPGTPYQRAFLLMADPENPTMGEGFHVERGVLQVSLFYPPGVGSGAADARAELIQALFVRGATFASGGILVQIQRDTAIGTGSVDEDRWKVPVRVRWTANIQ